MVTGGLRFTHISCWEKHKNELEAQGFRVRALHTTGTGDVNLIWGLELAVHRVYQNSTKLYETPETA